MSEREMVKRAKEIQVELNTLRSVEAFLGGLRNQWGTCTSSQSMGAQLALQAAIDRVKLMQWERE